MTNAGGLAPRVAIELALKSHGGLPSVGQSLDRLVRLLGSDTEALHELADLILADVSLTQRLLRLANTVQFRDSSGPVTTITRAIVVLGFDRVREAALSMVLLDGLLGPDGMRQAREEFHRTLLASALAREILLPAYPADAEEAAIAAMFRCVGRLLVAAFAPQAGADLRSRSGEDGAIERAAVREALGTSLEVLGESVLRGWGLPERVLASIQPGSLAAPPASPLERVRVVAQFSLDFSDAMAAPQPEPALERVIQRHAAVLAPTPQQLAAWLAAAKARTREFEQACGLEPVPDLVSLASGAQDVFPEGAELPHAAVEPVPGDEAGPPANSRELLLAGLTEATEALARGEGVGEVARIALESIHRGLGYARTALVLRDASGVYRARTGFGEPRVRIEFDATGAAPNLFSAALARGTDLHIADSRADSLQSRLPTWFRRDCPAAASFLVMPLQLAGRPLGFFYAERAKLDSAGLSAEELQLLRALRSQVLLALRQAGAQT